MIDSSLLLTLRLMDNTDLERLEMLVSTGFYALQNRRNDAQLLFAYLRKYAPAFADQVALAPDLVARQLFGHRAQPAAELRKAMSALLDMAQKVMFLKSIHFFVPSQTRPSPEFMLADLRQMVGLLGFYIERQKTQPDTAQDNGLDRLIKSTHRQIAKYWDAIKNEDTDSAARIRQFTTSQLYELFYLCLLAATKHYFYMLDKRSVNSRITEDLVYLADNHAAVFELISTEQAAIYQMSSAIRAPFKGNSDFKKRGDQLLAQVEHIRLICPESRLPGIKLFTLAFRMFRNKEGDEQAYESLLEAMRDERVPIGREQVENFKAMLLIYNSWRHKATGEERYLARYVQLQSLFLEDTLRKNNNRLSAVKFLASLVNALKLNGKEHLNWAKDLLVRFDNGVNLSNTKHPALVFRVCKVLVLYHEGRYEEAFKTLGDYKKYGRLDEEQCLTAAIRLDCKLRYELDAYIEDEDTRAFHTNMQRIRRLNDVSHSLAQSMILFVNYIKALYDLKQLCSYRAMTSREHKAILSKLDKFVNDISAAPEFPEKNWMLKKAALLKGGF